MVKFKPQIGDVYTVHTLKGIAYIQYAHNYEDHAHLIRVLPGVYNSDRDNLESLVKEKSVFYTITHVDILHEQNYLKFVGNFPLPEHAKDFPVLKSAEGRDQNGNQVWWITYPDGTVAKKAHLSNSEKELSINHGMDGDKLAYNIAADWTPRIETDIYCASKSQDELIRKLEAWHQRHDFYQAHRKKQDEKLKKLAGDLDIGILGTSYGMDMKGRFEEFLVKGYSVGEATKQLIKENRGQLNDSDEGIEMYLILAQLQLDHGGTVKQSIKKQALHIIDKNLGLDRWEEQGGGVLKGRKKELKKLKELLEKV